MRTKAEQLIKLARNNFQYLSEAELKLLRRVTEGKNADYSSTDEAENDPEKGDTWDKIFC
ncbi:MAG: hypothetical protein AB4063_15010 [Crocosphaera sp.]